MRFSLVPARRVQEGQSLAPDALGQPFGEEPANGLGELHCLLCQGQGLFDLTSSQDDFGIGGSYPIGDQKPATDFDSLAAVFNQALAIAGG